MAAFAATDVIVAVTRQNKIGKMRKSYGTLTFGDGSLTYPTAGVPLPAIGQFGFVSYMDSLEVFGNNARTSDFVYRYNKSANKLLMYCSHDTAGATALPLDEVANTYAPAARTLDFEAEGW
jgi:hypothetical protein